MKNAILIHGWNTKAEYYDPDRPSASNDHWFPWLSKQLMLKDIPTVSLEMPGYIPHYDEWKKELERFDIGPETTLVGHSCGGGFLVRWLSENDVKVGKVILVAPWLGLNTDPEPFDKEFFNFKIEPKIADKTSSLSVLISDDDMKDVLESVRILRDKLENVNFKEFSRKGHFVIESLGGPEFQELLDEVLE